MSNAFETFYSVPNTAPAAAQHQDGALSDNLTFLVVDDPQGQQ